MRKHILLGIITLAFLLRAFELFSYPPGFTPDEASLGYDAYSLLSTGKDQWGKNFPLVLESFGDFKPPLYAYLLTPSVAFFGLNKFAVRFPNALLGTLAVFVTYLMVNELFKGKKNKLTFTDSRTLGKIAALLLAISPWHVMMSRGAFEANLTTMLLPLGVFLFLRGLKDYSKLTLAAIVFGLNLFSYHSARVVTPLLAILLVFFFRKQLVKVGRKFLVISFLIFVFALFLTSYTFFSGAGRRAADLSIYQGALQEAAPERLKAMNAGMSPKMARLFHNKYQVTARRFINNYRQYFSARFLFTEGPAEATYGMIPGRGVLYWFELPFLIGFIVYFIRSKNKRVLLLILAWVLLAPIPASLATGVGYAANRAVIMLPALQVILALGVVYLNYLTKRGLKAPLSNYVKGEYLFVSIIFFILFVKDYFINTPISLNKSMLQGNLETAEWLAAKASNSQPVIVSRRLSEPHIYIAFASKWDPNDYQQGTKDWSRYERQNLKFLDQLGEYSLGNYQFGDIDFDSSRDENVWLVGKPDEFPEDAVVIKKFYYPNREAAVVIVDASIKSYAEAD